MVFQVERGAAAVIAAARRAHPRRRDSGVTVAPLRARVAERDRRGEVRVRRRRHGLAGAWRTAARAGSPTSSLTAQAQFAEARTSPGGVVNPGAYASGVRPADRASAPPAGRGRRSPAPPYDADDPRLPATTTPNSSGRIGAWSPRAHHRHRRGQRRLRVRRPAPTAACWRSSTRRRQLGRRSPTSPGRRCPPARWPSASDGSLWYATGEANTGGTQLRRQRRLPSGQPRGPARSRRPAGFGGNRAGEHHDRRAALRRRAGLGRVAARRVVAHRGPTRPATGRCRSCRNPGYEPVGLAPLRAEPGGRGAVRDGRHGRRLERGLQETSPTTWRSTRLDPTHVVAAAGWRSGDTYNGFLRDAQLRRRVGRRSTPTGFAAGRPTSAT